MTNLIAIACLQTRPQPDFVAATEEAMALAEKAVKRGARFLALPEYCGGLKTENGMFAPPVAEQEKHPVLNALRKFANGNKVWINVGSIAVPCPDNSEKYRNRSFVIDDSGDIRSIYDKIHLFDIQLSDNEVYRESARVSPGDRAVLTPTPFALLGHSICYDVRFASLYRRLAKAGAEILLVPAAFTKTTGQAHWHVLNRARAIENGSFVVAPCAIGEVAGGGESYGHSLIVNPWGEVLADGGETPGVILARIDIDEVAKARSKIPSLQHDREFLTENDSMRGDA